MNRPTSSLNVGLIISASGSVGGPPFSRTIWNKVNCWEPASLTKESKRKNFFVHQNMFLIKVDHIYIITLDSSYLHMIYPECNNGLHQQWLSWSLHHQEVYPCKNQEIDGYMVFEQKLLEIKLIVNILFWKLMQLKFSFIYAKSKD